jgi:hypothetical protein
MMGEHFVSPARFATDFKGQGETKPQKIKQQNDSFYFVLSKSSNLGQPLGHIMSTSWFPTPLRQNSHGTYSLLGPIMST